VKFNKEVVTKFFIMCFLLNTYLFAQCSHRTSGLGFRISFWNINSPNELNSVLEHFDNEYVKIGGIGLWFNFFSQASTDLYFDLNIGAVAKVEEGNSSSSDDSKVTVIMPILFGLRREIPLPEDVSIFKPYWAIGAGPYLTGVIRENDINSHEEVHIKSYFGIYAGGGINFELSNWLVVNFDLKYHLINLNPSHDYSNLDYGIGINFQW
jgi:hypothetical protein